MKILCGTDFELCHVRRSRSSYLYLCLAQPSHLLRFWVATLNLQWACVPTPCWNTGLVSMKHLLGPCRQALGFHRSAVA